MTTPSPVIDRTTRPTTSKKNVTTALSYKTSTTRSIEDIYEEPYNNITTETSTTPELEESSESSETSTTTPPGTAPDSLLLNETINKYNDDNDDNDDIRFHIDSDNTTEISETDKKLNFLIDKTQKYFEEIDDVYGSSIDMSASFTKLYKLNKDKKIDILWDYLLTTYRNNSEYIMSNFDSIKKHNIRLDENNNRIQKLTKKKNLVKNKIDKKDRITKLNMSRYNKMVFETNTLKNFMIFVIILLVIPILKLSGVLNNTISVISYFSLLVMGIVYVIYTIITNMSQRDNIMYDTLNFKKPIND